MTYRSYEGYCGSHSHSFARYARTTNCVLSLTVWGFAAIAAPGAPIVVKELSHSGANVQHSQLPTSVPFEFRIYEPNVTPTPVYTIWLREYSPSDAGMSFFAPSEVVAGATVARNSTTAIADLQVNFGAFHRDDFGPWWLGFPPGYYITHIESVLDELVLTPIDSNQYSIQFAERIRVWAQPIPEPTGVALLGVAISWASTYRLTVFGRHRPRFRSSRCPK
jgi:hypothetical protein